MLGYMTNILLQTSFGWLQESDRDSYMNKRIDLTGPLLNNLLRNYFNKLVKDMKKQIIREINTGSWKSNDDYENIITKTNHIPSLTTYDVDSGKDSFLQTAEKVEKGQAKVSSVSVERDIYTGTKITFEVWTN